MLVRQLVYCCCVCVIATVMGHKEYVMCSYRIKEKGWYSRKIKSGLKRILRILKASSIFSGILPEIKGRLSDPRNWHPPNQFFRKVTPIYRERLHNYISCMCVVNLVVGIRSRETQYTLVPDSRGDWTRVMWRHAYCTFADTAIPFICIGNVQYINVRTGETIAPSILRSCCASYSMLRLVWGPFFAIARRLF